MAVESSTTISGLNAAWPLGTDIKAEGDNHLRLLKSCLKAVFDDSGTTIKTTLPVESPAGVKLGDVTVTGVSTLTGGFKDAGGDNVIKLDWASSLLSLTIDGAAQGTIFTTVNSPFSPSGYTKLVNGFIMQWGFPNADTNGNAIVTFPVTFPNGLASIVGTLNSGSGIAAGTAHTVSVCNLANGSATLQARTIAAGSVVVAASANVRWIAVGY